MLPPGFHVSTVARRGEIVEVTVSVELAGNSRSFKVTPINLKTGEALRFGSNLTSIKQAVAAVFPNILQNIYQQTPEALNKSFVIQGNKYGREGNLNDLSSDVYEKISDIWSKISGSIIDEELEDPTSSDSRPSAPPMEREGRASTSRRDSSADPFGRPSERDREDIAAKAQAAREKHERFQADPEARKALEATEAMMQSLQRERIKAKSELLKFNPLFEQAKKIDSSSWSEADQRRWQDYLRKLEDQTTELCSLGAQCERDMIAHQKFYMGNPTLDTLDALKEQIGLFNTFVQETFNPTLAERTKELQAHLESMMAPPPDEEEEVDADVASVTA